MKVTKEQKEKMSLVVQNTAWCEATKESHWWIVPGPREKAQSIEPDSIALYLLNFQRAAAFMESNTPAVTIDASPNLMFQWP